MGFGNNDFDVWIEIGSMLSKFGGAGVLSQLRMDFLLLVVTLLERLEVECLSTSQRNTSNERSRTGPLRENHA